MGANASRVKNRNLDLLLDRQPRTPGELKHCVQELSRIVLEQRYAIQHYKARLEQVTAALGGKS